MIVNDHLRLLQFLHISCLLPHNIFFIRVALFIVASVIFLDTVHRCMRSSTSTVTSMSIYSLCQSYRDVRLRRRSLPAETSLRPWRRSLLPVGGVSRYSKSSHIRYSSDLFCLVFPNSYVLCIAVLIQIERFMQLVHCSCARLCRLCAPAITGNRQY